MVAILYANVDKSQNRNPTALPVRSAPRIGFAQVEIVTLFVMAGLVPAIHADPRDQSTAVRFTFQFHWSAS